MIAKSLLFLWLCFIGVGIGLAAENQQTKSNSPVKSQIPEIQIIVPTKKTDSPNVSDLCSVLTPEERAQLNVLCRDTSDANKRPSK